jgi:sigma-B regulation protein RsbQ
MIGDAMRRMFGILVLALSLATPLSAASVDGLAIHSSTTGTGPATMIFIHGWTCDSSSWVGQVSAFAKEYRVVTLDLPGHGKSGSPKDGKLSMDLFARAVEAVRAEAKAERVVLVGHSMGAPVIRQYARMYPQHVAGLVAVDGPLDLRGFPPPEFKQPPPMVGAEGLKAREKMVRGMFVPQTAPALQEHILKMMLGTSEATANGAMAAVFDPSVSKTDVIKAPALAVYAGTAKLPDPSQTKQVLPNYEGTQIAGTGHFLMMEKPDEFNRVLTSFLDQIKF